MRVPIHATPGAKQTRVGGCHDGSLRVYVTAPADQGKANRAIAKALAAALEVKPNQLTLISGQTGRRKVFSVEVDVAEKVAELMAD